MTESTTDRGRFRGLMSSWRMLGSVVLYVKLQGCQKPLVCCSRRCCGVVAVWCKHTSLVNADSVRHALSVHDTYLCVQVHNTTQVLNVKCVYRVLLNSKLNRLWAQSERFSCTGKWLTKWLRITFETWATYRNLTALISENGTTNWKWFSNN